MADDPTMDRSQIPVGVDGEPVLMPTPVTCTVSSAHCAFWVPRDRPGVPAPKPPKDWARPRYVAGIFENCAQVAALIGGSEMAKKKKDERDRDDAETRASSSATGEEAGAGPPAKMKRKEYERQMTTPARRARRHAGVGQGLGSQDLRRVRGPRHRREGRHDQADHRAGEPARVPGRGPARPDRAGEDRRCTSSGTSSTSRPPARS